MTEFQIENPQLTALQTQLKGLLKSADPQLGRIAIRDLFIEAYGSQLDPEVVQKLNTLTTPDTLATHENTESRAERILSAVRVAEFNSFQEYSRRTERQENRFVAVTYNDNHNVPQADDIITEYPSESDIGQLNYRSSTIPLAIAHSIDPNLIEGTKWQGRRLKTFNELYCAVGRKNGNIIIQGGGYIHQEPSYNRGQYNFSAFKVGFNDENLAQEFIGWLSESPNEALNSILGKAIGKYDEQGNFLESLLPITDGTKITSDFRGSYNDPFKTPINNVLVKDLRTA